MPISTVGRIVDADGAPVIGRNIVLQALDEQGWTTLSSIEDGWIELELPGPGRGRSRSTPVPLRLLDQSTQTPLVISSDPMWAAEGQRLTADFGTIRLREEPVRRRGVDSDGEFVIGDPLDRRVDDVIGGGTGIPVLREQLEARTVQLEAKTVQLETRTVELQEARHELSTARAKVDELTATLGTAAPVAEVITGLGAKLSESNTQLAAGATPFRLAGVRFDLRGRLGTDGTTIVMDGTPDGSGISADLVIDAPSPTVPSQAIPSVQGLTAAAASRVLRSVGFAMDSATQQLGPGQGVPGQALTQHPAPGAMAEFGTTVLVIFGARNESDE